MNKKWTILGWASFSIAVICLLAFAANEQRNALVLKPVISISIVDENAFLTEDELFTRLKRNNLVFEGQTMDQLNTTSIESFVHKMPEVESVDVFKRMGGNWSIRVKIREPYARIFNQFGESFYVDSKGATMNPSPNFTARVLVFSGAISDRCDSLTVQEIINNDSLKSIRNLDEIYRISDYVCHDPFLRAQISQVHRDKWGDFLLIPQVGGHIVVFGSAYSDSEVAEKMKKLKLFYQEGLPFEGWNVYEEINLKYRNQIVCKKKKIE